MRIATSVDALLALPNRRFERGDAAAFARCVGCGGRDADQGFSEVDAASAEGALASLTRLRISLI